MGQSTDGILAYGWDLGSPDDVEEGDWAYDLLVNRFAEFDDTEDLLFDAYGYEFPPNPYDEITEEQWNEWQAFRYRQGFAPAEHPDYEAWKRDSQPQLEARWAAKRQAREKLPVVFETHCSGEFPMYILAAKGTVFTASRGYPIEFDQYSTIGSVPAAYGAILHHAAGKIGIEPPKPPSWILASYWG
jgi:hypothetical protein